MRVIAGELYVTGGKGSVYNILATVERYSPSSNTWSSVAAMPETRWLRCRKSDGDTRHVNYGSMYVVGGKLQQTWKVRREADKWSEVAPLSAQRSRPVACSIGNDMFVIGGESSDDSAQSDVYKHSMVSNTWSTVSPANCTGFLWSLCGRRHDLRRGRPRHNMDSIELRVALRPLVGHVDRSCFHVSSSI